MATIMGGWDRVYGCMNSLGEDDAANAMVKEQKMKITGNWFNLQANNDDLKIEREHGSNIKTKAAAALMSRKLNIFALEIKQFSHSVLVFSLINLNLIFLLNTVLANVRSIKKTVGL